jgi:maleate isomerase
MMPEGVLVLETRVDMEPRVEVDVISQISRQLPEAARILSQARCDAIAIACTSGTVTGGPDHDRDEIREMELKAGGIPCTTVVTAVSNALRWMGVTRIALASPYLDNINEQFKLFFASRGIDILSVKGLGIIDSYELGSVPAAKVYKLGKAACHPDAQAIYIPCTTFPVIDAIEELERDTKKLVITSNQALAWEMMRMTGIDEPRSGFGELLVRAGRTGFRPAR